MHKETKVWSKDMFRDMKVARAELKTELRDRPTSGGSAETQEGEWMEVPMESSARLYLKKKKNIYIYIYIYRFLNLKTDFLKELPSGAGKWGISGRFLRHQGSAALAVTRSSPQKQTRPVLPVVWQQAVPGTLPSILTLCVCVCVCVCARAL